MVNFLVFYEVDSFIDVNGIPLRALPYYDATTKIWREKKNCIVSVFYESDPLLYEWDSVACLPIV